MFVITDDPVHDAAMYDVENRVDESTCPVCEFCGDPIFPGDEYTDVDGVTGLMHYECAGDWLRKYRRIMGE